MATSQSPKQNKYPRWFYAVIISIPILFFIFLEIGLRIGHYGTAWEVFTELSSQYPGILGFNPEIMAKYFPNLKNKPTPVFDGFERDKSANSIRIFVLGESSAAGWPYIPNASFPRVIKQKLELLYPDRKIEVINLGVSAVCSYTIRDILPDVLRQKPDAILIYTGHNEYYGALGAASTQSFGKYRRLVNFVLWLQGFRTVQLVQNTIKSIAGIAAGGDEGQNGNETLMAKVVGENTIGLGSELYQSGLSQFEGNMEDIIQDCKGAGVPVIIGNLACNLKDLKPFMPLGGKDAALSLYNRAQSLLAEGKTFEARALFVKAKDADALRFRAPSEINRIIKKLADKYLLPLVDLDSILSARSTTGIIGNDLMVDHLHPNVGGYRIMGLAFCNKLLSTGILPVPTVKMQDSQIDSLQAVRFPFTTLDSVVAAMRIRILTGSYPFVPKGSPNLLTRDFKPANYLDSLAIMVVERDLSLEEAHYRNADINLEKGDWEGFEKEIRVLIADRPMNPVHYEKIVTGLIQTGQLDRAMKYLTILDGFQPGEFTYKWIGSILVSKGEHTAGRKYLEKFVTINQSDPMVWYNLSGAYANTNSPELAIKAVKNAVHLEPRYSDAITFYRQLSAAYGMK